MKTKRIDIDIDPKDAKRLKELAKKAQTTEAGCFKEALRLYELMIEEVGKKEKKVILKDGDSEEKVIIYVPSD